MKAKEYLNAMQVMEEFKSLVSRVYPDKYNLVCMKHGIDERESMDMYSYLQSMKNGNTWLTKQKPVEYVERIITVAEEASMMLEYGGVILNIKNFGDENYGSRFTKILVVFKKDGKISKHEFDLVDSSSFVSIASLITSGYSIESIIRQSDEVDGKCFVGVKNMINSKVPIYDGDVMLCYVNKPEFWGSDWQNSGLYVCQGGSYYRLVYTPNKGYVRHGVPDMDEDFELDIEENAFSSYVMTLGQSWLKLGNVHVGVDFLIEKNK